MIGVISLEASETVLEGKMKTRQVDGFISFLVEHTCFI